MNGASTVAPGSPCLHKASFFLPSNPLKLNGEAQSSGKYGQRRVQPFAGAVHAHASGLLGKTPSPPTSAHPDPN